MPHRTLAAWIAVWLRLERQTASEGCWKRTLTGSMFFFFFQAEDGIRDVAVTEVQTCALPILLTSRFPDLGRHVRDDQGQIRQFLNVYLNEEDIRFLGGESCTLKEGDRVLLVPSIAGGC